MNFMSVARAVFRKEIIDSLRDKRTMLGVLLSGVVMGPLILIALSGFIASMEEHAEKREVYVSGLSHGPSLQNFLELFGNFLRFIFFSPEYTKIVQAEFSVEPTGIFMVKTLPMQYAKFIAISCRHFLSITGRQGQSCSAVHDEVFSGEEQLSIYSG